MILCRPPWTESRTKFHALLLLFAVSFIEVRLSLSNTKNTCFLIFFSCEEHLGLIPPQECKDGAPKITSFMRPAPFPNMQESGTNDQLVADPISDATDLLWKETARKNREIFSEIFKPVPTNLVRSWAAYDVGTPSP